MNATSTATGMVMSGMSALGTCHRNSSTTQDDGEHHLDERLAHVVDRAADQRRAVVDRDDLHPGRQARLDLADALLDPIDHVDRVLSLAHHDDPRHHFAGAVQIRDAAPQIRADRHVADVADPDRRAALAGGHDDALEVGDRLRVAAAAHHVLGAAELDQPAASLRRCRRAPPRRRAGSRGRSCAAGSGRRSPGTAGRSRRARPPPTRRAPPSGR